MTRALLRRVVLVLAVLSASQAMAWARTHHFTARHEGEAVATVSAETPGCGWERTGAEAAVLRVGLDGRYSQHLPLVRGEERGEYRVALGHVAPGRHALTLERDTRASAPPCTPRISRVSVEVVGTRDPGYAALSLAPVLHLRPGTLARFSDLPVLGYVERFRAPGRTEYRYTVVFTHEDGGTPADRLMATWGRTTDIEFVYGVHVGDDGRVLSTEIQGPDHARLPFDGRHEAGHPLLWVTTDNNMVEARGTTVERVAPAFERLDLAERPRETAMDLHPWIYRVMSAELAREGRVAADAPPGSGLVPPVDTFVYVDACATVVNATLALSVGTDDGAGGTAWFDVDRGVPEFRLARSGCSRVAVPVPGSPRRITAVRARAVERSRPDGEPATAAVRRIGVLVPGERGEPRRLGLPWQREERLAIGGPWVETAVRP